MPFTPKGREVMANMQQTYGSKKGKQVFYASAKKGTIKGVHGKKHSKPAKHPGNPVMKTFH